MNVKHSVKKVVFRIFYVVFLIALVFLIWYMVDSAKRFDIELQFEEYTVYKADDGRILKLNDVKDMYLIEANGDYCALKVKYLDVRVIKTSEYLDKKSLSFVLMQDGYVYCRELNLSFVKM